MRLLSCGAKLTISKHEHDDCWQRVMFVRASVIWNVWSEGESGSARGLPRFLKEEEMAGGKLSRAWSRSRLMVERAMCVITKEFLKDVWMAGSVSLGLPS